MLRTDGISALPILTVSSKLTTARGLKVQEPQSLLFGKQRKKLNPCVCGGGGVMNLILNICSILYGSVSH